MLHIKIFCLSLVRLPRITVRMQTIFLKTLRIFCSLGMVSYQKSSGHVTLDHFTLSRLITFIIPEREHSGSICNIISPDYPLF